MTPDPNRAADHGIDGQGLGARQRNGTQNLAALAVALLASADFLALMGIGGLPLAWAALGLWLAAVTVVVTLVPPREEDV